MDGVAKTAYYCCGVRAADAERANPVCGDQFAKAFMTPEGQAVFSRFAGLMAPNQSNVTRARIIDDWLRERLAADPDLRVILLGAGFDTRAFRLDGGRWAELDQPPLIAEKEARLPASQAKNPLQRISVDFATERLADKLEGFRGEVPVVVLEGVSMYLPQDTLRETLTTLQSVFPRHTLICDLMSATFRRKYGGKVHQAIVKLGGSFAPLIDNLEAAVTAAGYRETARVSMVGRARDLGAIKIPRILLATFLKPLRDGYTAHIFEAS